MVRLRDSGLSAGYRRSLHLGWSWLRSELFRLCPALTQKSDPRAVDRVVEQVVQAAYDEGKPLQQVVIAVIALQRRWSISGNMLYNTWKSLKQWKALRPVRGRIPFSRSVLEGLILTAFNLGMSHSGADRAQWWAAALAWWCAFEMLLRPGELLQLKVADFIMPLADLSNLSEGMVAVIRAPKTKRIYRTQVVLCKNSCLIVWMQWWLEGRSASASAFGLSRYKLDRMLREALNVMGWENTGFTLGSLRAGGATDHFRRHQNLGVLQYHGRWKVVDTLQHYLHVAFTVASTHRMPALARARLNVLLRFKHYLQQPPRLPAISLFTRTAAGQPCGL